MNMDTVRKVGDTVYIRKDLKLGESYTMEHDPSYSEYVTERMHGNRGKKAEITFVSAFGYYRLDIDPSPSSGYTDGMFESVKSDSDEADILIEHMLKLSESQIVEFNIDKALRNNDRELFMKVTQNLLTKDGK